MSKVFNAKRFFMMITREFTLNKKNLLIIALSMVLIGIVISYFGAKPYTITRPQPLPAYTVKIYEVYPFIVLVYCAIIVTYSFMELNTPDKKIDYLMLPATTAEKYFSKFVYTTFGFILLATLALAVNTLFVKLMNSNVPYDYYKENIFIFYRQKVLQPINYWPYLHYYLVLHAVLFFAGVYFVKLELPKILLTVIALALGINLFSLFLNTLGVVGVYSFGYNTNFQRFFTGYIPAGKQISVQSMYAIGEFQRQTIIVLEYLALFIVPIFFWILGFMRLREIEVKDGV
jgi:hypothetical protein